MRTLYSIGVGRFRILGGPRFRILGGQIPSKHMTSMRRKDIASTSFRRHVPTRFLINQCQIITFLILKSDIIENSRIELRGIGLPVPSNQIKVTFIIILPFNLVLLCPPEPPPPPPLLFLRLCTALPTPMYSLVPTRFSSFYMLLQVYGLYKRYVTFCR